MASSKISKTEKKKSKDGESTEAANKPSKARKDKDLEKKKKNKYNEKEKEKEKVKVKDQKNKKKDNDNNKDKEQKNKRNKLSNGHVKENKILIVPSSSTEEEEEEKTYDEDNTEITNGQTTETKPKKGKRKKGDDDDEVAEDSKTHRFPMHRIKTIIRAEDIDSRVSQEAVFVINKATEKFLEQLTQNAYTCSVQDRKKSLSYKHLSSVVSKQRRYDFLSDFVPEKVKAEDALGEKNSGGKGGA